VDLPPHVLAELSAQRADVRHDLPDLILRQLLGERRHLRIRAAVPDLVEHHAVRVPRGARRIGEVVGHVIRIGVRSVALARLAVALLAVVLVDLLALRDDLVERL